MPFDSEFNTKISPLIDGQVPDYIQSDHPIFVEFLKQYYKFLESAQITIDGTIDQVLLETLSDNYLVLDATDISGSNGADRIVFESGSGTTGKFDIGETITGVTSKATATILVDDDEQLFITANQKFIEGETITGGTSNATTTLKKYRANPVQNIQQLLEYANPDNTVDHFLSAFKDSFMNSIPLSLASGVSKRNLIKHIRDLYAAKGTSEGHKLFFRIFLGEEATINYPAKYMMRLSDGKWANPLAIRCTSDSQGATPSEMAGQQVTGASSGTTAQIIAVSQFNQGSDSIVEFTLRRDSVLGTGFSPSETITGYSPTNDYSMQFTIQGIVLSITTGDFGGILYNNGDTITLDPQIGNGASTANISQVSTGSISDVIIDDVGTGFNIGDAIKFTNDSDDTSINSARAFVSVTGGRLSVEYAADETSGVLVIETGTNESLVSSNILLNGTALATVTGEPYVVFGTARTYSDTQTYYYPLYLTEKRASTKNLLDGQVTAFIFDQIPDTIFYMPSNNINTAKSTYDNSLYNLFHSSTKTLDSGFSLRQESSNVATGMDVATNSNTEAELGDLLISEIDVLTRDSYGTETDGIILEDETVGDNDSGSINRIFLAGSGGGYSKLPTATVSSVNGINAKLICLTTDIGAVTEIEIIDSGFKYSTPPTATANTNLILKDVFGSFGTGNTLQTHTGSVVSFDSSTNKLTISSTPTNRLTGENSSIVNEGIELEDFDIVGPGRSDLGPINEIFRPLDDANQGILIDGFSEEGEGIAIENSSYEEIIQNASEVDVYQINMEIDDTDSLLDEGIELESGSFIVADESGKFLLDGFLPPINQRIEDHIVLEDDTVGKNIFGEQLTGVLIFNFTPKDINDNIRLEGGEFDLDNVELETSTENEGDKLIFDGTSLEDGDKIEYQRFSNIIFGNNTDAILSEDSINGNQGSPSYITSEDAGNTIILNATEAPVGFRTFSSGDKLLQTVFDVSEFSNHGQSIKHSNTPHSRLLGEGLETFVTEDSPVNKLDVGVLDKGRILYNNAIYLGDEDGYGNIIDEAGDRVLNENASINLILDGTDLSGEDAGSQILIEDEVGTDQIILNQTQANGTDIGDEIVMEDDFNVVGNTILDSSGASAKIVAQGTVKGVASIGTTINKTGSYLNTDSLISEDIIRIQDSYFYQQFSYEVKVGAVLSDYINELKASVHPAGFIPFGKVSLASQVSAAVGVPTAVGVVDYTGDDTFSPTLASLFNIVFDEVLVQTTSVRDGPGVLDPTGGSSLFDTIIFENGVAIGDLLLEETDGDNLQFESGLDIAVENSQSSGDGTILLNDGGGRLLAETALGENESGKRSVTHLTTLKITPQIIIPNTGYGAPLASGILPGSGFFDSPTVQLEDGLRESIPVIMQDNLVLDGTDKGGTDNGDKISYEIDLNANSGIPLSELNGLSFSDLVEIDTVGFTEPAGTLKTTEGAIVFEQSSAGSDDFVLETWLQFITEDGDFIELESSTDTGYMIGVGNGYPSHNINIVLDGTNINTGKKLVTEGSLIEFEDTTNQGSIPEGNFGNRNIVPFTRAAEINSKSATDRLSLQDEYENGLNFRLEDDSGVILFDGTSALLDIGQNIVLEGTDSSRTDEGNFLIMDRSAANTDVGDNIILDSSGGRDLSDKIVMFDNVYNLVPDNEGGFFLLDGTDSDGTNAGFELLVEKNAIGEGTFTFLQQNSINSANNLFAEAGGLQLSADESSADDGAIQANSFDSNAGSFDSTSITFDAA